MFESLKIQVLFHLNLFEAVQQNMAYLMSLIRDSPNSKAEAVFDVEMKCILNS